MSEFFTFSRQKIILPKDYGDLNVKGKKEENMKSIVKGIGFGMAIGGTAAYLKGVMAGSGMKKMARKKSKAMIKAASDLIGDMKYMFK